MSKKFYNVQSCLTEGIWHKGRPSQFRAEIVQEHKSLAYQKGENAELS